jgi:hypothetical protein
MADATPVSSARDRRWLILAVIGLAQLMVVLDLTVMNIALPSAQRALHFPRTAAGRSASTGRSPGPAAPWACCSAAR